ncbi:MAG: hypothetical protein GXO76_15560, partial [Calditrichaeota bacterium]|nr:hypothetical protein [Calditrichota bacterium]
MKESPYAAGREYLKPLRPGSISSQNWQIVIQKMPDKLWPGILNIVQTRVFGWQDSSRADAHLRALLGHQFEHLKQRLVYGVAGEAFRHPEVFQSLHTPADILAYLQTTVRPRRVLKIWNDVFRDFAFGPITYQDAKFVEHTIAAPGENPLRLWKIESPNARALGIYEIGGRSALEIAYDVSRQKTVRFVYQIRTHLPADSLRRFVIPIKGDESYYKIAFRLDTPQGVFRGKRAFLVDVPEWKQGVWQIQKPEKRYEMEHIQLIRDPKAASTVTKSG